MVTSLFWLFGSIAMSLTPSLITQTLHGAEILVSIHLALFAVGIAIGSGLAAFLLKGKIVLLPSAVGAALVAFASADLRPRASLLISPVAAPALSPRTSFAQPLAWRAAIDLSLLAVAGGLMIVPSFAAIQAQSAPRSAPAPSPP